MADLRNVELQIALAEGVVSRAEAEELNEAARRLQRSPLDLLADRGVLSQGSVQSLRAEALRAAGQAAGRSAEPSPASHGSSAAAGGPDGDATLPIAALDEQAFPVAGSDRYMYVRFLGQGGMGKVFLAIDRRLRREVAIKFVHGDDPAHVRRLIVEARTQARVDHPQVCKVHEVGESDGKVYIAMQYIAGAPLGVLAGELSLEQKVVVMRGAADGIHEAHRAGIIHRDIKPSNILVSRGDDGALRPYVVDFGLARSAQSAGATQSGAILGTPWYMAPEQAHGDVARLDRRADVYSLGATLFHLLAGAPPIAGRNALEVLANLANHEPRPLRSFAPDIPADLEAIVAKCLEKDRRARYDSARALADDLGRFLDGEPVRARPAGAWYRLRKRLARHRRLVAAAVVAVTALAVAIGWGLALRGETEKREALARRFTERIERIEASARYSALAPAHDIRLDRAMIRLQMAELAREIAGAGSLGVGPGHYALGRGYLALDDDATARAELEAAWRAGFREPRAAYALALVFGHLYRRELLAAERIEQAELRAARTRTIERAYREPALDYLAHSQGAEVPSTDYVAALVAFYEGRHDDALRALDAIGSGLAWFYEAHQLRGDILLARALRRWNAGDRDRARLDFAAGRAADLAATAVAESVPAVHEALAELEYQTMVMELYGGGDVAPAFERTIAATARALAIQPDYDPALVQDAKAHRTLAEHRSNHGSDTQPLLDRALADLRRAVAIAPDRPEPRLELAQVLRQAGEVRESHGEDPGELLRAAVEASAQIAAVDRDTVYYGNLGQIYKIWADHDDQVGADPQSHRSQAIDAYTRALRLGDHAIDLWINLGIAYVGRAAQPRAGDTDADLDRALDALDRARALDPGHTVPRFYEGEIHALRARRARDRGRDPAPELARALDAYRAGIAINRTLPHLHNGAGIVLFEQAKAAWDRGADPAPQLAEARAAFEQAVAVAPDQGFGYDNIGSALALQAWFERARDEDPSASVRAAAAALGKAIERIPEDPTFWADLAMVHAIQAGYDLDHARDPRSSLAQATAAVDRALARNQSHPQAQRFRAETRGLAARLHARDGHGDPAEFAAAAQAFERAVELAPDDLEVRLVFGELCRARAEHAHAAGGDPDPVLQRGLALADHALATRPGWPDARVLRASLELVQAQHARNGDSRHAVATLAANDFANALAANPSLARRWRQAAARAHRLATDGR